MLTTTKEILRKYNFTNWELFYHYIIISGELPSVLADKIFNYNTKKDILKVFGDSSDKPCFKYHNAHNINGHQLTKQGKERARELSYDYNIYINEKSIKSTNNTAKRTRYRNHAYLTYFFDLMEIEYMKERINNNDKQNTFTDSYEIKGHFDAKAKRGEFAGEVNSKDQIRGSRAYGVIELEQRTQYITYVEYDNIGTFRYPTESRYYTYSENYLNSEYTGIIIFTEDIYSASNIIERMIPQIIGTAKENKTEKILFKYFHQVQYTCFQDNRFLGMHIISFDDVGKKQMGALKTRSQFNQKIRTALYNYEKIHNNDNNASYDGSFNGIPCIFLYSLDIQKMVKYLNRMKNNNNRELVVVCFKEHRGMIRRLFNNVNENKSSNKVHFITLEELDLA